MLSVGEYPTHRLTDERARLRKDTVILRNSFAVKKLSLSYIIVINEDSKVRRIVRCKKKFNVFFRCSLPIHIEKEIYVNPPLERIFYLIFCNFLFTNLYHIT